jgi:putative FmdB family regulatory protein
MPVYEYLCDACGPFDELRPLAAFAQPCECPVCGAMAGRNLVSAPALGGSALGGSAGAPPSPGAGFTKHAGGCGCCAPRRGLRADAVGR